MVWVLLGGRFSQGTTRGCLMEESEACDVVVSDDTGGGGEVMMECEGGGSIRIFFAGCEIRDTELHIITVTCIV